MTGAHSLASWTKETVTSLNDDGVWMTTFLFGFDALPLGLFLFFPESAIAGFARQNAFADASSFLEVQILQIRELFLQPIRTLHTWARLWPWNRGSLEYECNSNGEWISINPIGRIIMSTLHNFNSCTCYSRFLCVLLEVNSRAWWGTSQDQNGLGLRSKKNFFSFIAIEVEDLSSIRGSFPSIASLFKRTLINTW